ncbi:MAG TPA: hypothetical protein VE870_15275 [Bacteroidales bacterium]|nr:hypothetical protein [Bacteroidales bacterium]
MVKKGGKERTTTAFCQTFILAEVEVECDKRSGISCHHRTYLSNPLVGVSPPHFVTISGSDLRSPDVAGLPNTLAYFSSNSP